jgi:hypothetical protein
VVLRDAWETVRERLRGVVSAEWLNDTATLIFDHNARQLYRLPALSAGSSR